MQNRPPSPGLSICKFSPALSWPFNLAVSRWTWLESLRTNEADDRRLNPAICRLHTLMPVINPALQDGPRRRYRFGATPPANACGHGSRLARSKPEAAQSLRSSLKHAARSAPPAGVCLGVLLVVASPPCLPRRHALFSRQGPAPMLCCLRLGSANACFDKRRLPTFVCTPFPRLTP